MVTPDRLIPAFEKAHPGVKVKPVTVQYDQLHQKLVTAAAVVNQLPLAGCCFTTAIFPEGETVRTNNSDRVSFLSVSDDYLRAMGLPLRRGRSVSHIVENRIARVAVNHCMGAVNDHVVEGRSVSVPANKGRISSRRRGRGRGC